MRQKRVAWLAVVCYNKSVTICFRGVLAQLARAPRWHRGGHEFESHILHQKVLTRTNLAKKIWLVWGGFDKRGFKRKISIEEIWCCFLCLFFDKGLNSRFLDLMFSSSNSCLNSMWYCRRVVIWAWVDLDWLLPWFYSKYWCGFHNSILAKKSNAIIIIRQIAKGPHDWRKVFYVLWGAKPAK